MIIQIFDHLIGFEMSQTITKNSKIKNSKPNKNYAVKAEQPLLKPLVLEVLTNQCRSQHISDGRQSLRSSDNIISETYFIKEKGAYYQGEWAEGIPHGWGLAIYHSGVYYEGNWVKGQPQDNQGFLILPNGSHFRGNFKNATFNGEGIFTTNEYEYKGEWLNGKPNGYGEERYVDGSFYKGDFRKGVKEGKGTYFYQPDKTTFIGSFLGGLFHGEGQFVTQNGTQYHGSFIRGKKQGNATLKTNDGTLQGFFKNDYVDGVGKYTWEDGKVFEGQFKKSKFHGKGILSFPNGQKVEGFWQDGHNSTIKNIKQ